MTKPNSPYRSFYYTTAPEGDAWLLIKSAGYRAVRIAFSLRSLYYRGIVHYAKRTRKLQPPESVPAIPYPDIIHQHKRNSSKSYQSSPAPSKRRKNKHPPRIGQSFPPPSKRLTLPPLSRTLRRPNPHKQLLALILVLTIKLDFFLNYTPTTTSTTISSSP